MRTDRDDHRYSGNLDVEVYGNTVLIFAKESHSLYIHQVNQDLKILEYIGEIHGIVEELRKKETKS